MCGIAGSINSVLDASALQKAQMHRGPDAQTSLKIDNVHMVHNRLSIIDAQGGAQPMQRGTLIVTYNGEIYNHMDLRREHNLACETHSDTETLLAMFEKHGEDCLQFLDGMFAFAIYDTQKKSLFLARDRAGEKPLYIYRHSQQLIFASELNALRSVIETRVNEESIGEFLATGVMFGRSTPYQNIEELEPGHKLTVNTQTLDSHCEAWYSIIEKFESPPLLNSFDECLEWVNETLTKSIQNQLLSSDLEVGAFLSGGIDSGLVCAIAAQKNTKLKTFTVSFDGQFDESPLANLTAKRYGTDHTQLDIDYSNLENDIENIIGNYGEPIADDSIVPTWYVSRAASEHVTVVLTGDGADELFGGYRRYVPYAKLNLFKPLGQKNHMAKALSKLLPTPGNKISKYNYLYRLCNLLGEDGINRYLASTTMINGSELLQTQHPADMLAHYDKLAKNNSLDSLRRLMAMDSRTLLCGALLPKMDIGSMVHSLETRTPFLSKALMDHVPSLPSNIKVKGSETKTLLRHLAQRYLDDEVCQAPKRGFETPLLEWVNNKLRQPILDTLDRNNAFVRNYYPTSFYNAVLHKHENPPLYRARLIWMWYCTEVWHQKQIKIT